MVRLRIPESVKDNRSEARFLDLSLAVLVDSTLAYRRLSNSCNIYNSKVTRSFVTAPQFTSSGPNV